MKECPVCLRCFPDQVNHCPTDGDLLRFYLTGDTVLDGRYQLERRLGQGGMGAVFKARHIFLKTQHAIKIILPDLVGNDPTLVTRFRQEAMAAAAIRHPNIIAVTDFGVVSGTTPFLVMEFVEGRSLHDLLGEEERLSAERALEIMTGIAAGLSAAHRQGIVHRDLKPLNIMLRNDAANLTESVKLLDFGLAKIKSSDLLGSFVAVQTTGLMGSPFYMAPEQWGDDEPDARSDIYSLGIILYQMLAGEVPFRGGSIPSIMSKHLTSQPPSLAGRGISPAVEAVVRHALEKEPINRPQTVEELIEELSAAVTNANAQTARLPETPLAPDPLNTIALSQPVQSTSATTETVRPAETAPPPSLVVAGVAEQSAEEPDGQGATLFEQMPAAAATTRLDEAHLQTAAPPRPHTGETMVEETTREAAEVAEAATDAPIELQSYGESDLSEVERTATMSGADEGDDSPLAVGDEDGLSEETRISPKAHLTEEAAHRLPADEETRLRLAQQLGSVETQDESPAQAQAFEVAPAESAAAQTAARASDRSSSPSFDAPSARATAHDRQASAPSAPAALAASGKKTGARVLVLSIVLIALVGACVGGAYYFWLKSTAGATEGAVVAGERKPDNVSGGRSGAPSIKPDLVELPGMTFLIGRAAVQKPSNGSTAYLAHMYTQWPAHFVTLAGFAIDRHEVTCAEYSEFVRAKNYAPPSDWNNRQTPPAGQDAWPVRNVSFYDAESFARWRSERDGVQYRLPTEEEWEYAARGGDLQRLYPWGADWIEGRANLARAGQASAVQPVGSFPEGRTPQGVDDMIGNVWEWTSSEASIYKGNNLMKVSASDAGKVVTRGGSYASSPEGDQPVSATARRFTSKETKDPTLGFRLVRPEPKS